MPSNKQWYELLGEHIKADIDERGNDSFAVLSRRGNDRYSRDLPLSPITNFLLNVWGNSIENNKSLILNFPGNMIKTIPLLAFMYSEIKSKSTLVFTSGNVNLKNHISGMHNRAYHLLNWERGGYVYRDVPMATITKNALDFNLHMPHASTTFKQKKDLLKKELLSSDKPKILLNGTDNATKITSTIENVFIENKELNQSDFNLNLNVGCLIFENADRYISSSFKAEQFINWLKETISEDILVLLHFSNSNLNFISDIKENTNSIVLPFNQNILRNNSALSEPSLNYFDGVSFSDLKILNNYNLDNENTYNYNFDISIVDPILEKGNLDLFLNYSYNILNKIKPETLKNRNFFYRTINLLYSLNNLAVNPSFYKFNTQIGPSSWRYINVPQFIGLFASRLDRENDVNQFLLNKLISNLNNFYNELFKCKRYGEEKSYNRIGKDYQLLDIIFNKNAYFKEDKKLLVGVYQNTEPKILNKYLGDLDDVEVVYLRNLFYNSKDMSDYNILLPGIVPPNYFSILKRPFNQVLILAHEGSNRKIIQNQIDLVLNPSIGDEKVAMGYFEEIYDLIGESKNNAFFNDFNKRYSELSEEIEEESVEDEPKKGKTIKELFEFTNNYKDYAKGRKLSDKKLESTIASESSSSSRDYDYSTVSVNLRNLMDDTISTKKLHNNKKYLRFKKIDDLNDALEVRPALLKKNDYIIVLESNKSFLDIYMDIFGEDIYIDRDFIDYWKDVLFEYKEKNELKYNQFYEMYKEFCEDNVYEYLIGEQYYDNMVNEILKNPKYNFSKEEAQDFIKERLLSAGFGPVSYQTFRMWVNGYIISPLDEKDLYVLGKFLEDNYIIENYKEMAIEAESLRTLNRSMGRKLSHIIKSIIQNSGLIDYDRLGMEERYIYDMIKNSVYQVV